MNEKDEKIIKEKLLVRGFSEKQLLNNRGLIGATIDETEEILLNKIIKKGNCFWGHKWSKWKLYTQPIKSIILGESIKTRQRRTSLRCGKTEDEMV